MTMTAMSAIDSSRKMIRSKGTVTTFTVVKST
jgi:hypothetical protein